MMINSTVRQLATTVGIPVERLLEQLQKAGMRIEDPDQTISLGERQQLLAHLQRNRTFSKSPPPRTNQVTLIRKSVSELKIKSGMGKGKTVSIKIRKKKDYLSSQGDLTDGLIKRSLTEVMQEDGITTEKEAPLPEFRLHDTPPLPTPPPAQEVTETTSPVLTPTTEPEVKTTVTDKKARSKRDKRVKNQSPKTEKYHWEQTPSEEAEKSARLTKRKTLKLKSRKEKPESSLQQQFARPVAPVAREIRVPLTIKVADLAQKMSIKAAEVIKFLMKEGVLTTINQIIDQDTAIIVAEAMGHVAKPIQANILEESLLHSTEQQMGDPVPRSPIVTIMGHVDHGKTSLLDYIRRTKVTLGEAGGITQHIGAYHVEVSKGVITFLDTPGHSAFTAMRARGAQVTDIVVLVVAADDGVMPQTIEAIHHAKAANVPIVVAVNKIDKSGSDLDRIQSELAKQSLISEAWGGDTMFVPVSAKTGEGIDDLLEAILTQAEMLELKAAVNGPAQGTVIESRLDKGRGPVATILVQRGLLHKGDILLAGSAFGRVRALLNEGGQPVLQAGPSMPVEVLGLSALAVVGDEAVVVKDERKAREIALFREAKTRVAKLVQQRLVTAENIFSSLGDGVSKTLNIVFKADSQGSVEALQEALTKLSTHEIKVKLLAVGVGAITESDVHLAMASKALLLGFNVRGDNTAKRITVQAGVTMHYHSVIYNLLDQVKSVMSGLLSPEIKETIVGLAEVREIFRSTKLGTVAGCLVTEGLMRRNHSMRVLRDNVVIYEGELHSLRRFQDDVNEVRQGAECGIRVKNYTDIRTGDTIEVYESVTWHELSNA